jgi:uncharacterized protein
MSMYPSNANRTPLEYSSLSEVSMVRFFNQVYAWMSVGLAVTAVVGYACSKVPAILMLFTNQFVVIAAALGLFALAWVAQTAALTISAAMGLALFMLYSAVMGFFLSGIFIVYQADTLLGAFAITGGLFAALSVAGFVIKKDLSGIGGIAAMAVMGLFLASLFNVFFASNALSWFITYGVLIAFIVIVAWKTQELKNMANEHAANPALLNRIAVVGSIILYISFINLFLSILRILGSKR